MAYNSKKNGKNGKKAKPVKKKNGGAKAVRRVPDYGLDKHARSYLRLLSDPCGADLVPSLYEGSGAAYQIRLNSLQIPGVVGTFSLGVHAKVDILVCFIPGGRVLGTYGTAAGNSFGACTTYALFPYLATGVVQSYRCVAACMKFQPNGEYSYRSGTIGSYPETNLSAPATGGFTAQTVLTKAISIVPVGSEQHEIVWCPTAHDGNMKTGLGVYDDSTLTGGVISMVLTNVDAIGSGPNSAVVQGFINLTACYEWIPETNSTGAGIPSNIASVPRTPMNTALSTLGNMSKWATHGFRAMQSPVGQAAIGLLTRGVQPGIHPNQRVMRVEM